MNTITYLQKQFDNIHTLFHSFVADLTEVEWVTRPAPDQNMLGYNAWHMPRIQDSFVQTWIRGVAEVAHGDRWAHWQPLRRLGVGVGITLDEADEIARSVTRSDVLGYADAVHQEMMGWLKDSHDDDLDRVHNIAQRLSPHPEYQTPGFVEEVGGLFDTPTANLLMRPCIGHVHRHLGELEVVKHILRA